MIFSEKFTLEPKFRTKICCAVAALLFTGVLTAVETVTELDFTRDFDLKELFVNGKSLPLIKAYDGNFIQEKDGDGRVLRVKDILWPLGARSKTPVEIGDKTVTIVISSEMRQEPQKLVVFTLVLTSKVLPDRLGNSGSFRKGLDSGFGLSGYPANTQDENNIFWRKEGMDYFYNAQKAPFSFMDKEEMAGKWMAWQLVYDHVEKTLSLFLGDKKEPHLIQHNVDLNGVTLNSMYFGARTTKCWSDFRKVMVKVTEK